MTSHFVYDKVFSLQGSDTVAIYGQRSVWGINGKRRYTARVEIDRAEFSRMVEKVYEDNSEWRPLLRDIAVEIADQLDPPDFQSNPNSNEDSIDWVEETLLKYGLSGATEERQVHIVQRWDSPDAHSIEGIYLDEDKAHEEAARLKKAEPEYLFTVEHEYVR